ncbi:hypothetical protein LCGC14_1149640 [marine sediment metagenome]|uniref:THIF-type NAD/FAD binding fold domain-containing protein n=1 Tax=marine sediment metagenome TaxID=412755 RepID=A0A0F9PE50_9ZZZZ
MNYLTHEKAYRKGRLLENRDQKDILILGAGALGSWLVDLLARQGYNNLSVLDFDKVEAHNFGTQNYGRPDIGRSKAQQLSQNVMRRIGVKVNPIHKKLNKSNVQSLLKGRDLVIDVFDNYESRKIVKDFCENSIVCIHSGMSQVGFFQIAWNEGYRVAGATAPQNPDIEAPCDYPLASNLVMVCAGIVAETINIYIDGGKKRNSEFWLGKMIIEVSEEEV